MILKLTLHNLGPGGGMHVWVNTDQISTMHERFAKLDGSREFSFTCTEVRVVEQGRWVTHEVDERADNIARVVDPRFDVLMRKS